MATVLFLAHRLPFPPNKGDKVRSFHVLQRLLARHRVLLGTFVDDPADEPFVPQMRALCSESLVRPLRPNSARLRSARGLLNGQPLSVEYYNDAAMHAWVQRVRQEAGVDAVWVFSSTMIQYASAFQVPVVIDFADVESQKWAEYGRTRSWPMSWVYAREGRKLLDLERASSRQAACSLFATDLETDLFKQLAPDCAGRVATLQNGVDVAYFASDPGRPSPFGKGEVPVVFCGTMDYWPNVDAVTWLVRDIWPRLRVNRPELRLHIVGRHPTAAVQQLAGPDVHVTGTVADVRPYLQHAACVLAPVRLARGIQNKVLEAMSMGQAVVATSRCADAIEAQAGVHLLTADDADGFVRQAQQLLQSPQQTAAMGRDARQCVLDRYTWPARLAEVDAFLGLPT